VPAGFAGVEGAAAAVKDGVLTFIAENVPPVGCKRYALVAEASHAPVVTAAPGLLENEYLRVRVAPNGDLLSVYDKENGREVLSAPGNRLSISHDKPIHESAWNLEKDYQLHMDYLDTADVEVLESSPVRGALRVTRRYHASVITQVYALYAGARRLDFETRVEWAEREKVLKAEFPLALRSRYSAFEVAHGALERPTFANDPFETAMFECCAHQWADLSESDYGVSLLNNCKYGHDISGSLMRITLMRGPVCPDPKGDLGRQDFVYSLYPHAGGWSDGRVGGEAHILNQPLTAVFCPGGTAEAAERSYLSVSAENVTLEACKAAENGEGIILRFNETERRHTQAAVLLPFAPARVYETNLMEENEREVPFDGCGFSFPIKPFEVKTFRVIPRG
jgi:alpha-mannosidase